MTPQMLSDLRHIKRFLITLMQVGVRITLVVRRPFVREEPRNAR